MMKKKWCKLAALALTCGSLLAAGCGGGGDKKEAASGGKKVSGNVMVYTSMYPDVVNSRVKPAVQKAFPDLKVNWFQGGTEKIKTKIAGEIKAGQRQKREVDHHERYKKVGKGPCPSERT